MRKKGRDNDLRISVGNKILEKLRRDVKKISKSEGERFYYQRFIFQRLKNEEDKIKRDIKKRLLRKTSKCYFCKKKLPEKDIIVHRLNEKKGYLDSNIVFAHRKCHQSAHK